MFQFLYYISVKIIIFLEWLFILVVLYKVLYYQQIIFEILSLIFWIKFSLKFSLSIFIFIAHCRLLNFQSHNVYDVIIYVILKVFI